MQADRQAVIDQEINIRTSRTERKEERKKGRKEERKKGRTINV